MDANKFKAGNPRLEKIAADILKPVGLNKKFHIWMAFLTLVFGVCFIGYFIQLRDGLGVTGMRDYVSWGIYIASFVFFVAASLIGMLISGVLGLIGYTWIKPIARIAEIIAVAFAAVAGLVIVTDMGRPDRLLNVFLHGRVQSPILWDVTVVTTYMTLSALLYIIPLIPDLAIAKSRMPSAPKWLIQIYDVLSMKWTHNNAQYEIMHRMVRILAILIVPTAFAIHTVTSWLFAVTPRAGWDSTIFGPYFLSGAFVAGAAGLIIAMYFFRRNYKLHDYITLDTFDKAGKLLALVSIVYFYFNINEFLVPAYKMKAADAIHINELFFGHYAPMFWFTQITGLILPILFLLFKPVRKPLPMLIISIFVLIGSWLKRYIIVIPTMEHPFLPKQYVPQEWMMYTPTMIEIGVTLMTFVMVIMIISVLAKLFPVVPIWEMVESDEENEKALNE